MNKVALFGGIMLGVIAGLGWSLYSKGQTTAAVTPTVQQSPFSTLRTSDSGAVNTASAVALSAVALSAVDIAQIRAIVHEELAATVATLKNQVPPSARPVAAPEPPPTPELVAERKQAMQTIQGMINSGEWGNDERITFHQKMAVLDSEQGARALHDVIVGLNTGAIHVTTDGPAI